MTLCLAQIDPGIFTWLYVRPGTLDLSESEARRLDIFLLLFPLSTMTPSQIAPIVLAVVSCDPEGTLCAAASLDHVYCMFGPRQSQERWESFVQVETLKPRQALCMRIRSNRNKLQILDSICGYS